MLVEPRGPAENGLSCGDAGAVSLLSGSRSGQLRSASHLSRSFMAGFPWRSGETLSDAPAARGPAVLTGTRASRWGKLLQDCTALTTDQQIPPSLDPTAKDNLGNQAVRNKKMCNSFQEVSLSSFCLRGADSTPGSTHLASYRHSVHRVLRT